MFPTSGAQVVTVPPSGAVGGHVLSSGGVPGAVGSQPQFVRVTPEGVMAGQGNQQGPPPYNPDEQVRTCFCFIYLFFFVDLVFILIFFRGPCIW